MAILLLLAGGSADASTTYPSVTIPSNLDFSSIASTPKALVLSGTATLDGDQGVNCLTATVNPTTLALSGIVEPKCDTPRLSGKSIVAVQTESRTMEATVRIARLSSSGHIELGPVLLTYEVLSDTHLETAYASGSLWLYAPNTPSGGRAIRVSEATGQVLQDTPVSPAMDRPVIAANSDGLYLAPTFNTGFLTRSGTANENGIIYHIGIGASGVKVFDPAPGSQFTGFVSWMTGSRDSLWADICQRQAGTVACAITRFNGMNTTPVFQVSDHDLTGNWVVGNKTQGFYSTVSPSNSIGETTTGDMIIRIDPATGAVQTIASVTVPTYWQGNYRDGSSEVILFDRSLFLLVPPGSDTPGTLYRIPLSEHN